jgi:REP element-mobilizing transposase RayT
MEEELHAYISSICNKLECYAVKVGGYNDHIHILCQLSKKIALMKLLEEIKSHSSKWIKTKGMGYTHFYWQNGYAAFSVKPSEIDRVIRYIERQHVHHGQQAFQEEMLLFFKKYNIEYDPRYVWE